MSREREIRALLSDYVGGLDESFDIDESLIASGLLDSLGLFQLVLWVEEKTGPIDTNAVDVAHAFDSIRLILNYIDHSAPPTPSKSQAQPPTPVRRDRTMVEIVKYAAAYKRAVVELQEQLWGKDLERNRRYLEWKYEENPFRTEPVIYLALRQGEVVGMRGFYGSRWQAGRSTAHHDVLVADDLLVRDGQRNQGIVRQLMQAALEDLRTRGEHFVFNLSGSPVTVLSSLAMGWRSAGALEPIRRRSIGRKLAGRIRRSLTHLPFLRRRSNGAAVGGTERSAFANLDRHIGEMQSVGGIRVELAAQPRCEEMADLVRRTPLDGRIRHVQDAAYYGWRLRNPSREYRFFYAGEETLDGFLIVKRDQGSDPSVRIVDLQSNDERTRAALLASATRPELLPEMYAWSATLRAADNSYLERAGFEPVREGHTSQGRPCILVRATDDGRLEQSWEIGGVPLLDRQSWDMRMIFSMAG